MDLESIQKMLTGKKIPILILDQSWHQIFDLEGKPQEIIESEKMISDFLAMEARYRQEITDLKKLKSKLMENVLTSMEDHEEGQKKQELYKKYIEEINQKLEHLNDTLLELPALIKEENEHLLLMTLEIGYGQLRMHTAEIRDISEWLTTIRDELKKKIIRRQSLENSSKNLYVCMHQLLGSDVINVFDLMNEDVFETLSQLSFAELLREEKGRMQLDDTETENELDQT